MEGALGDLWIATCKDISCPDATTKYWGDKIHAHYSEPQRFYHSVSHLVSLAKCFQETLPLHNNSLKIRLAIFFHDAIYEPTKNDNEEQSAVLFEQFADEVNLDKQVKAEVSEWILATKSHQKVTEKDSEELKLFIDMDLSIFGGSREEYKNYAINIRKEYVHYPEEGYRTGRPAVLQKFLPQEGQTIYKSDYFKNLLEENAKSNILWEIDELAKGLIQ